MKNAKRKAAALLVAVMILAAVLPASTQAACSTPGCVKEAAQTAMNETGEDTCFVVKTGKDGKGTGYFMYRQNGKVHCDRSGAVILGKNERIKKGYHYYFYRNREAEKKVETWKKNGTCFRQRYTSYIECAEDADFGIQVHSYVEYKQAGSWKTCKGASKNTDGLGMCKEFARYLWSMADPDCPVVFM